MQQGWNNQRDDVRNAGDTCSVCCRLADRCFRTLHLRLSRLRCDLPLLCCCVCNPSPLTGDATKLSSMVCATDGLVLLFVAEGFEKHNQALCQLLVVRGVCTVCECVCVCVSTSTHVYPTDCVCFYVPFTTAHFTPRL